VGDCVASSVKINPEPLNEHWVMTLNLVLFSLFPCVLAISTREIWTVMGWHSGWNWLLAVGFETPETGLNTGLPALLVTMTPAGGPALNGGVAGPEGSLVTTVAFVAGILLILAKRRAVPLASLWNVRAGIAREMRPPNEYLLTYFDD
jgi:uncharacterized protein